MSVPLFSVVIPTRNRPHYLGDAIASVLGQDDADLECVVSDNFNEPTTRAVVDGFASDRRLRYVRTDRVLNMVDHWEFATGHAAGEYVLVLADRKLLFQGALGRLRRELTRRPEVDVFSVGVRVYDDQGHRMGWRPPRFRTGLYALEELARSFLCDDIMGAASRDVVFPKTLNGGYRSSFARCVRAGDRRYFNNPGMVTPDYSSFFVNCALAGACLHVGDPLILTQGEHESNGRRFGAGDVEAYLTTLGVGDDLYDGLPFTLPFIYNLLMADFLRIRRLFGGRLQGLEPDWPSYLRTLRSELEIKRSAGRLPPATVAAFEAAWREAAGRVLDVGRIEELGRPAPAPRVFEPWAHVRDFINHRFSHVAWVNRVMGHRFARALDAAGF